MPVFDRSGRLSPEKTVALAVAVAPALWLLGRALLGDLGPRPVTEAIRQTGDWAVRLLFLTLAVTPARRIFSAPRLILARRTLGVATFCYAALHLGLYILDQKGDLLVVAREILLRFYLTIGFVALLSLTAMASTSNDRAVRRLGSVRWNRLHMLVYPIAILAVFHFALQEKLDATEPLLMGGLLSWLFGYRLLHRATGGVTPLMLVGLALAAGAATAALEAGWYAATTGVDASRVLAAQLDVTIAIRPALWVAGAGLLIAAIATRTALPQRASRRSKSSSAASGAIHGQSAS